MRGLAGRGALAGALAALGAATGGFLVGARDGSFSPWLIAASLLTLAGAALGALSLYHAARTVRAVQHAADRVVEGDLAQRVSYRSAATAGLSASFNQMADRVARLFEATAAERARLEALFAALTDPAVAVARGTEVQFLNPAAAALFAVDTAWAIGRPFIEIARDYELDGIVRRAITGDDGGQAQVITFGPRRVSLRAVAVPIPAGGEWAVLLMLTDLTEVQRIDQVRRDFVSNVSHELRTPLASIKALVETIEAGDLDARENADFLARIHQQVDRLAALVNELLDLSRIESGAIDLRPESVGLVGLVAEAASLLRARSKPAGVAIDCPAAPEITIEGDRPSLLRVVANLLDNAIKYSPPGGTVRLALTEETGLAALSVSDEGPGITPADQLRVFERFYKSDHSRADSGTGLGLAIVKHLVRAHGGSVDVRSTPGAGATFTVRLPKTFAGPRRSAER